MDGRFWYVYILQGVECSEHYYVGMTEDLHERLKVHNALKVAHTSKLAPWRIEAAIAFRDKSKAVDFERYLKTHSGRGFAKKHF